MSAYIELNKLDLVVLGQVQWDFSVDGQAGFDLATACLMSTFKRTVAVEQEIAVVSAAAKIRAKRCQQFGEVMELVNAALAYAGKSDADKLEDDDSKTAKNKLQEAYRLMGQYGFQNIDGYSAIKDGDPLTGDLRRLSENLKFELDKEDNALKRDASMVQSMMSKRDSSVGMQGKIQKKVTRTELTTIMNIGK